MRAAATMAHLRTAVRAYAGEGRCAAEVIDGVSRLVERTGVGLGSTLLVVALDGPSGELDYASAGHPPALVAGPEGARWFAFGLAPPLGLASTADPRAERDVLAPGETLVLFTDGLVERRDRSLDHGLAALRSAAADVADRPVEELCDEVLARFAAAPEDDVCLLAVRTPARGSAG
jgi:serine phosphatase RsbU (regulator of sigma subunit)